MFEENGKSLNDNTENNEAERKEPENTAEIREESADSESIGITEEAVSENVEESREENTDNSEESQPVKSSEYSETDKNDAADFAANPTDERAEYTADENAKTEEPGYTPPEYRGKRINMKIKNRKNNKLITAIVIAVMGLYLLLIGVVASGVFGYLKNIKIEVSRNGIVIEKNGESLLPQREEPDIEEHLKIDNTPSGDNQTNQGGKLSVKEIAKKVRASVVGVIGEGSANFSNTSVGSGIIMTEDGYIITNNHVIQGMTKISVITDSGDKYNAYVVGTDSRTDLAVLKVEANGMPAATFGDSDKLEQGDMAVAIGNPAGIQLQNTVTSGIISAINRDIVIEDRNMTLLQTDASINPGNSGGPLVNEYGQVIGINTVKIGISYYEGLGFAIPINTAKPIIDELISRGYVKGRPSIGINGTTITKQDAMFYGLKEGLYIEYVHPHSDAYRKGIQRGDVITKMNGTPLTSTEEIKKIRDQFKAGDTVTLTIFRAGKERDFDIILMDEAELNRIGRPD